MERRSFIGVVAALVGAGVPVASLEALGVDEASVGRLAYYIDLFGPDAVARHLVAAEGQPLSIQDLVRSLRREKQRDDRRRRAGERRERHSGNEVLYLGPVVTGRMLTPDELRARRSGVTGHAVWVGETAHDMLLSDIGVHQADGGGLRDITIPAGSRIVVDARRGWHDTWACEVVQARRHMRLHLWQSALHREVDDSTPRLRIMPRRPVATGYDQCIVRLRAAGVEVDV